MSAGSSASQARPDAVLDISVTTGRSAGTSADPAASAARPPRDRATGPEAADGDEDGGSGAVPAGARGQAGPAAGAVTGVTAGPATGRVGPREVEGKGGGIDAGDMGAG
ncbi:hypothetical protein GCM10023324_32020 [Streptomyces youssoufiensis]